MAVRSPVINVMANAALKAARGLIRDFGEVEQLQVSVKGPSDFVSSADLRAPLAGRLMAAPDMRQRGSALDVRWCGVTMGGEYAPRVAARSALRSQRILQVDQVHVHDRFLRRFIRQICATFSPGA